MPLFLIPLILQVLSALPSLIHEAEAAFGKHAGGDSTGQGASKKQFVMDAVTAAMAAANATGKLTLDEDHQKAILAAASAMTDATVAAFNVVGVFKRPAVAASNAIVAPQSA